MASDVGKKAFDWHWADESLRGMEASGGGSRFWRAFKFVLYFADEAAIMLVVAYLAWRYLL